MTDRPAAPTATPSPPASPGWSTAPPQFIEPAPATNRLTSLFRRSPDGSDKGRLLTFVDQVPTDSIIAHPARTGVVFSITNVFLYSMLALAQWAGWGGLVLAQNTGISQVLGEAFLVFVINLAFGLLTIAWVFRLHPGTLPTRRRYATIAAICALMALPRSAILMNVYTTPSHVTYFFAEWLAGLITGFIAVAAGVLGTQLLRNIRAERSERLAAAERAARAVDELQTEEMRVRRMVSDQLHGNLQFRLLTVTAGIDAVADSLADDGNPDAAASLRNCAERLEEIRETEVRSLSHAVFPAGIELGLSRAIEAMLRRLPPQIETSFEIGPGYQALVDDPNLSMPLAERLVGVYAIEEAVSNALKHGRATNVVVQAEAIPDPARNGWLLDVTVLNNGCPVDLDAEPNINGLARHADRLAARGGSLALSNLPDGTVKFHLTLPFQTERAYAAAPRVHATRPSTAG